MPLIWTCDFEKTDELYKLKLDLCEQKKHAWCIFLQTISWGAGININHYFSLMYSLYRYLLTGRISNWDLFSTFPSPRSGKSTYLQQVCLIVILAQVGCYVPARFSTLRVVDRMFTRMGAVDNLESNSSTVQFLNTHVVRQFDPCGLEL